MDVPVREAPALDEFLSVFQTAWAFGPSPSDHMLDVLRCSHTFGAYQADRLVGTALDFDMALSLPGGGEVPMAGVSYVAVHPLFRRRGVLRALMRHQLEDLHRRHVPVAGLGASEGSIYGRFGYGPATREIDWTCPRGILPFLDGSLDLVDRDTALRVLPAIHERARRHQVGDVRAYPGRFVDLVPADAYVVVAGAGDGYAVYRLERPDRYSSHCTLIVEHLVAVTDSAYRSLWSYLVNLDLIEHVVARSRPESEVLPLLLDDHRKVTVTASADHLWIRLVDLPAALSARGYGYAGSLVLEVTDDACPWNTGRWRLDSGLDGATCRRATSFEPTDLTMDVSALGSLYLGGVAPGPLAAAGRLRGTPQALLRAAALFATPTPPWCSIGF